MGTPDFAVESLKSILDAGHEVAAVITATDKLGGRGGKQILQSEVKKFAIENGLKVLQPSNLKSASFIETLKSIQHDIQVVVAFRMLPESVWSLPPLGTVNVHASLLPKYRGAAPINWAIICGEKQTGVTVFKLKHEIDTGQIIRQAAITIEESDDFGSMYDKLKQLGALELKKALQDIEAGEAKYIVQADENASHAPKIFHETCIINFNQPARSTWNFIRGLSPIPAAWFIFMGQEMKIIKAAYSEETVRETPGSVISDRKKQFKIACTDGYIIPERVKYQGKKEMAVNDFLNGFHWPE